MRSVRAANEPTAYVFSSVLRTPFTTYTVKFRKQALEFFVNYNLLHLIHLFDMISADISFTFT